MIQSIVITHPYLAEEWHYEKNNELGIDIEKCTRGLRIIVWWKCKINPCGCHIWQASIKDRVHKGNKCPYCINRKICRHNSLAAKYPQLLEEWDYEKNIVKPDEIAPGTGARIFWVCKVNPCGCHKWNTCATSRTRATKTCVKGRIRGSTKCPFCTGTKVCKHSSLAGKFPELMVEWDYEKNSINPEKVGPYCNDTAYWICKSNPCGCHKWENQICNRTGQGAGCPYCSNHKMCLHNNFAYQYPNLLLEWDYEMNEVNPYEIAPKSDLKVWWICSKNPCGCHKWSTILNNRTIRNCNCPYCSGRKTCSHSSFAIKYPNLLTEWDYKRNSIDPYTIDIRSTLYVYWICSKNRDHKWKCILYSRVNHKTGCPRCKRSKGEFAIVNFFKQKYNVEVQEQYRNELCYDIALLPFDIYVEQFNLLIEFDGEHHFIENSYYNHKNHNFADRIMKDQIKTAFAVFYSFSLLRIAYTDIDRVDELIEKIISKIQITRQRCIKFSNKELYKDHIKLINNMMKFAVLDLK